LSFNMKTAVAPSIILAALSLACVVASATELDPDDPVEAPVCLPGDRCADGDEGKFDGGAMSGEDEEDHFEHPDVEWCRRRPTWRYIPKENGDEHESSIDIWEMCSEVLGYEPDLEQLTEEEQYFLSSDYDPVTKENKHDESDADVYFELPVMERPMLKLVASCMDEALAESEHYRRNGRNTGTLKAPFVETEYVRPYDDLVPMAIVGSALCEEEAETILALTECAKKHIPDVFEHRKFEHTDEGGGNDTTFVAGFLQILAPGVAARTYLNAQLVWETVGWSEDEDETSFEPADLHYFDEETEDVNAPDTTEYTRRWFPEPLSECGIRTSEHLSYDKWGVLGYHEDTGSDYTVLAALSEPNSYEGGGFSLCPDSEYSKGIDHVDSAGRRYFTSQNDANRATGRDCPYRITIKPERLSAIVFLSIFSHGVEDILSPGRVMFTNEFWRYGDVPATVMRPGVMDFVLGINEDDDELFDHDDDDEDEDFDDEDTDEVFEDINEGIEEQ